VPLVILGIDPGLANTGWGLVECEGNRFACRGFGCISSSSDEPIARRLERIHRSLVRLIELERPSECAVENVYFSTNVRTAFATGQARGVALLATAGDGLVIEEYGPSEIKQAVTGDGRADKRQIGFMVKTILGLEEEPDSDHAADALAVAICHANSRTARSLARSGPAGRGA
jgi:crossover junction endodeoxyribonuclease RuvC